jgi:hypothetical protein
MRVYTAVQERCCLHIYKTELTDGCSKKYRRSLVSVRRCQTRFSAGVRPLVNRLLGYREGTDVC